MQLSSIDLYVGTTHVSRLKLSPAEADPFDNTTTFRLTNVTGLDADEILSTYYGTNAQTNQPFMAMSMPPREITLTLEQLPGVPTGELLSGIQGGLYSAISANRSGLVELRFNTQSDLHISSIFGYITKLESPSFAKKVEVKLTIRCDDPLFRSPTQITVVPNMFTVDGVIDIYGSANDSTAPTGFQLKITFNVSTPTFIIQNPGLVEWQFIVNHGTIGGVVNFEAGDSLYMSSEESNKWLYLVRPTTQVIQLIDKIQPGSVWPILFPGNNVFNVFPSATGAYTWNYVKFHRRYWSA